MRFRPTNWIMIADKINNAPNTIKMTGNLVSGARRISTIPKSSRTIMATNIPQFFPPTVLTTLTNLFGE